MYIFWLLYCHASLMKFIFQLSQKSLSEVCFTGDSICNGLARYPKVWNKYFRPLQALNFGIGGDRTQHVLWRVENGEIPRNCRYIAIHCGTNNLDRSRPKDIANGILSIGVKFQEHIPNVRVLISGILPRDEGKSQRAEKIAQVNGQLSKMCSNEDLQNFHYIAPDPDFSNEDGSLNTDLYYHDFLHLNEKGDMCLARSIHGVLINLMREDELKDDKEKLQRRRREGSESKSEGSCHLVPHYVYLLSYYNMVDSEYNSFTIPH